MRKMESNNWILVAAVVGAALLGAVAFFMRKRKELEVETVEVLSLNYVKEYFKNSYKPIVEATPKIVPVLLKVKDKNLFKDNDLSYQYYMLTYYNEESEAILESDTKVIRAKRLDTNLTDAFGDKDMLVLS